MVKKDHYDQIDNSNNQYAKLKKFRIGSIPKFV